MSVYSSHVLNPLILILLTFAVARMVVLLVKDKITEPVSKYIINRFGPEGFITFGWHCVWCQGVWWAGAFTAITYQLMPVHFTAPNVWLGVLSFLAVAFAGSYLADR